MTIPLAVMLGLTTVLGFAARYIDWAVILTILTGLWCGYLVGRFT